MNRADDEKTSGGGPSTAPPIRVLHFFDKLQTQGSTYHGVLRLFSLQMPAHHHDRFRLTLCCLKRPDETGAELARQFATYGIPVLNLMRFGWDVHVLPFLFFKTIREVKPDVLHLHGYAAHNIGRVFGRILGIPTLCHEHAVQLSVPLSQKVQDRLLVPFTDFGIAVSENSKRFMVEERGFRPDQVFVVPNGLDFSQLPDLDPGEVDRERKDLGIPPGARVVGAVGRLATIKGQEFLLKAAKRILESYPNTFFPVVGDGDLLPGLRALVRDLGIENRVIFTGFRPRINPVLSALDVMVMPSLQEGFGMALIEGMYKGLPIVASEVGGMKEIIVDGENGLFAPPGDPEAIAEKVIYLLEHPDKARLLADGARKTAARYTIAKTVSITEGIYRKVVSLPGT